MTGSKILAALVKSNVLISIYLFQRKSVWSNKKKLLSHNIPTNLIAFWLLDLGNVINLLETPFLNMDNENKIYLTGLNKN